MPKKNNNKPPREMTKHQMTHWQRESRLQHFIMLGGIVVIIAILAVLGTGLFMNKYKPYHQTVIKVGNTEYSMDYYINMLAFEGTLNGGSQLIPYLTDYTVQAIEQNQLIVEAAANLTPPTTVSEDEVKQEIIKEKLTSDPTRLDVVRAKLVYQKLQSDYLAKEPQSGSQKSVLAMFLESQSQVDAVKARLNAGEKFSDIAAQLSLEKTSKDKKGDFTSKDEKGNTTWVPQGVLSTMLGNANDTVLDKKVFASDTVPNTLTSVQDTTQSKTVGYWILKVGETEASTGKVHVYAMELGSADQAKEIKAKLDAGEDFATLAKANSQYPDAANDGGDLGLVAKGELPASVDGVIFPADSSKALPKDKVTEPIQDITQTTTGGFWLLQVSESQTQPISDDNRTILSNNKLQTWGNQVWTLNQSTAQSLLTEEQKAWAAEQALSR